MSHNYTLQRIRNRFVEFLEKSWDMANRPLKDSEPLSYSRYVLPSSFPLECSYETEIRLLAR